jgi:hypothetical protein
VGNIWYDCNDTNAGKPVTIVGLEERGSFLCPNKYNILCEDVEEDTTWPLVATITPELGWFFYPLELK